jgi:hypothetical protein
VLYRSPFCVLFPILIEEPGYLSGIELGCGPNDRGVRVPVKAGNFSLHHRVQNGSGAHPASYPLGSRDPFPGGKAADV